MTCKFGILPGSAYTHPTRTQAYCGVDGGDFVCSTSTSARFKAVGNPCAVSSFFNQTLLVSWRCSSISPLSAKLTVACREITQFNNAAPR
jgi:hypothetical protein